MIKLSVCTVLHRVDLSRIHIFQLRNSSLVLIEKVGYILLGDLLSTTELKLNGDKFDSMSCGIILTTK